MFISKDGKKQLIVDAVERLQGAKATELVVAIAGMMGPDIDGDELVDLIDELVTDNKLLELEYILPSMPERMKSFLLPAKSKVFVSLDRVIIGKEPR